MVRTDLDGLRPASLFRARHPLDVDRACRAARNLWFHRRRNRLRDALPAAGAGDIACPIRTLPGSGRGDRSFHLSDPRLAVDGLDHLPRVLADSERCSLNRLRGPTSRTWIYPYFTAGRSRWHRVHASWIAAT